jgi:DNA-binding GntR family transcriptional regulator
LTTGPSLADQAYEALRDDITTGRLSADTRITERWLAQRLGVSPTPVREALTRLEHEHLIERGDGNAIRVAEPSLGRLHELSLIEAALRGVAARIAAVAASDRELARLSALCDEVETIGRTFATDAKVQERVLRLTRDFHLLVDQASHNPTLVKMIATATAARSWTRCWRATASGRRRPCDTTSCRRRRRSWPSPAKRPTSRPPRSGTAVRASQLKQAIRTAIADSSSPTAQKGPQRK